MKRFLPFLLPFFAVLAAGGIVLYLKSDGGVVERGDPVDATFSTLSLNQPFVRIKGVAHYGSAITQHIPATLLHDEDTFYVFGFFPEGQESNRGIDVLVRTRYEPEAYVNYEHMTIEGRLSVPTLKKIPASTESYLSKKTPYFMEDEVLVIEAWQIESGDATWTDGKM